MMQEDLTLTEDEQDVLQELMNVAYGNATAVVAEMLEAFATLSIPKIQIMPTTLLIERFQKKREMSYFFSSQAFNGEFNGETAFFIDAESANNLATHLELDSPEDLDDAILELTNVLTSSLTTKLAQEMDTQITFAPPNITKLPLSQLHEVDTFKHYSQVIVIETELNFKEQKINGDIYILTKDGSIQCLKKQLNALLEALT